MRALDNLQIVAQLFPVLKYMLHFPSELQKNIGSHSDVSNPMIETLARV